MEELEAQELEQEAILPEGYGEGDDYFREEDWGRASEEGTQETQTETAQAGPEQAAVRDLHSEAQAFFAKNPRYLGGAMPGEVLAAWLGGAGLGEAFARYESGQSRAETRRLQRENQVLRQNAEAAGRAPVRGVGGGGDTGQEPEDPFLVGFNDEKW